MITVVNAYIGPSTPVPPRVGEWGTLTDDNGVTHTGTVTRVSPWQFDSTGQIMGWQTMITKD